MNVSWADDKLCEKTNPKLSDNVGINFKPIKKMPHIDKSKAPKPKPPKKAKVKKAKGEEPLTRSPKRTTPKRRKGRKKVQADEDSPWESDRENENLQLRLSKSPSKLLKKSPLPKKSTKPTRKKRTPSKKSPRLKESLETPPLPNGKSQKGRKRKTPDSDSEYSPLKEKRGRKRKKQKGSKLKDLSSNVDGLEKSMQPKGSFRIYKKKYSVVGYWYIASGYLNDIINLLDDFEAISGWRFSNFATCWRKRKFSLIYRGRQTFKELLEFSEEVALLTKRFMSPPHSMKRRIGALYALYGLYFKHPVGHFFNLRFDLQEYQELLELIQPFRSNPENPDPAFVLRKLEVEGALRYCASSLELCYDFHNEEREYVDLEYGKQRLAKSSAVEVALPKIQLETDAELLKHYNASKCRISDAGGVSERSLSMLAPAFTEEISQSLSHLRKEALDSLAMSSLERLDPSQDRHQAALEAFGNAKSFTHPPQVHESALSHFNVSSSDHPIENLKSIQAEFEALPSSTGLEKPLLLIDKSPVRVKKSLNTEDDSLDLDSNELDNGAKSTANMTSNCLPDVEDFNDLPMIRPTRKKADRRNKVILNSRMYEPSQLVVGKDREYNLYIPKTLDEDNLINDEMPQEPEVSKPTRTTATSLLPSELPLFSSDASKANNNSLLMKAVIASDKVIKVKKLRVKVSRRQWNEIRLDEKRLNKFKATLMPLLIPKEGEEKWSLQDLSVCPQPEPEVRPKEEPPSYVTMFDELPIKQKRDDPYQTPSDSSDDSPSEYSSVHESDSEPYPETESDDGSDYVYVHQPMRNSRKSVTDYSFGNGMRDDSLIQPQGQNEKLRMIPVKIGNVTKYIPADIEQQIEEKKDKITFHSWNDFSSSKPPVVIRNRRKSTNKMYTIMYPTSTNDPNDKINQPKETYKKFSSDRNVPKSAKISSNANVPTIKTEEVCGREELEEIANATKSPADSPKDQRRAIEDIASDWQDELAPSAAAPSELEQEEEPDSDFIPDDVMDVETGDVEGLCKFEIALPEQSPLNSIPGSPDKPNRSATPSINLESAVEDLHPIDIPSPSFINGDVVNLPCSQGSSEFKVLSPHESIPHNVPLDTPTSSFVDDRNADEQEEVVEEYHSQPYENLPTINVNLDPVGKPLFYMLKDSVGNNVFIPISSFPPVTTQNRILTIENPIKTEPSPLKDPHPTPIPEVNDDRLRDDLSSGDEESLREDCSYESAPQTSSIPAPSSCLPATTTPILRSSRPSCSFLFSSKLKALRGLTSVSGKASGKPPEPPSPPVKFLIKGSLKGARKKFL